MANLSLPAKYAQAFFGLVKAQAALAPVKDELVQIKTLLHDDKELAGIFYHPGVNREDKKIIIKKTFEAGVSKITLNLMQLLVDKKREAIFNDLVNIFLDMVDTDMGIRKVTVSTAYAMTDKEKKDLISSLEKAMHTKLQVKTEVDSDMLGGVIIKDRFTQVDASLRQFLRAMKQDLHAVKVVKKAKIKKAAKKPAKKKPVKKNKKK